MRAKGAAHEDDLTKPPVISHILFRYVVFVSSASKNDTKTTQLNPKQISGLALHLIFHRFSRLTVV